MRNTGNAEISGTIRRAGNEDVPAIRAMYAAAKTMPDTTWNEYYPGEEEIAADLAAGGLYVLEENGVVVGAVTVEETDDLDALPEFADSTVTHRSICRLVIAPAAQGRRLGAFFLTELFTRLHADGVEEIRLLVAKQNGAANATYRRLGFEYVGECAMYGVDFHVCRKTL